MNMNNYTIKSQEAVQEAVQIAQEKGQQAIETGHLLKGIIAKGENITNFIFNKLGVNGRNVVSALDRMIDSYPKVSGGSPYLSEDTNKVLEKATKIAGRWVTSMSLWNTLYWACYPSGIKFRNY